MDHDEDFLTTLARAAKAYDENNGVIPMDIAIEINNAGISIDAIQTYLEENA